MTEPVLNPTRDREAWLRQTFAPDPVIEAYKQGIDQTLIRENLKLTPEQRLLKAMQLQRFAEELRTAGRPKDLDAVAELELIVDQRHG